MNADADLSEVPKAQRRHPPKPLRYYSHRYKDCHEAMAQAYRPGRHSLKAIADHFGVHYSTVSRAGGSNTVNRVFWQCKNLIPNTSEQGFVAMQDLTPTRVTPTRAHT